MIKKFDWLLLAAALLLSLIGLVVLHAINFRDPSLGGEFNLTTQVVAAGLGLVAFWAAARTDYRLWLRLAPAVFAGTLILMVLLITVGKVAFGASLSIDLGFFEFQPTEVAKLAIIFMLARLYALHSEELRRLRWLGLSLGLTGLLIGLMLLQPDFGSAAVIGFIWLVMTFVSRLPKLYLAVLITAGLLLAPIGFNQLADYQQARLQSFVDPTADPQGAGYNVNQARIAVGSGQLFGRGLSGGSQSQLNFLPSQHTDFAFAVVAEKLGLVGAGLVLALFGLLLGRTLLITWRSPDWFGVLLGSGITAVFLIHTVVAVGINLGLVPVTGLPLPFISYGGTNLIASLFMVGLLQSIATHRRELQFQD